MLDGDRNFPLRKFPPLSTYAVDADLFRLESPILMRAKRATNRNNVGGELSPHGVKNPTLREIPVRDDNYGPNGKLLSYRQ